MHYNISDVEVSRSDHKAKSILLIPSRAIELLSAKKQSRLDVFQSGDMITDTGVCCVQLVYCNAWSALCVVDSVDTRGALDAIRELVSTSNVYIEERQKSTESTPSLFLLENIVLYITKILKV